MSRSWVRSARKPGRVPIALAAAGSLAVAGCLLAPGAAAAPVFSTALNFGYVADTALGLDGSVAVVGWVLRDDHFQPTPGAYDQTPGNAPGYVAKIDATGRVAWASYIGGDTGGTDPQQVQVGPDGTVYVTGATSSDDFPTTAGAYARSVNWNSTPESSFATRFSADGSHLEYSTFLPRLQTRATALDGDGRLTIGAVAYPGYEATEAPIGPVVAAADANPLVLQLDPNGTGLRFSALFGGSHDGDSIESIDVGATGDIYLTGRAESADFPVTAGAVGDGRALPQHGSDVFAARVDPASADLVWSTRFGGLQDQRTEGEQGQTAAVRPDGSLVVEGVTDEPDFPLSPDAPYTQFDGAGVGSEFVAHVSADGSTLYASTLVPGGGQQRHQLVAGADGSLTVVHRVSDTQVELWRYNPRNAQLAPADVSYPSAPNAPTYLVGVDGAGTVYLVSPRSGSPAKSLAKKTGFSRRVTGCTITGTNGDDRLRGTPRADVICGLGGDDVIRSLARADVVYAGRGDDIVRGGRGVDVVYGGAGRDTVRGQDQRDQLAGGRGADILDGARGDDTLIGGPGDDDLRGGTGRNDCHQATARATCGHWRCPTLARVGC